MRGKVKYNKLVLKKSGIKLDVGCGGNKQPGFVGMDIRKIPGVDIVHNAEVVPYPLPDACCHTILLSHLIEHMCPKRVLGIMNELWRIMKPQGQLLISSPYAGSPGFYQDPTHCHTWNEATVLYFDPYPLAMGMKDRSFLYDIYKPSPWKILRNTWSELGNLEIILEKREDDKQ
jgi:predicted SAM-dependent methyltransferase